jgi:hypothetical protein
MNVNEKKLIFITGTSRSGTTLLSFLLRNHREIFGLRELQYFGEAWDPLEGRRRFSRPEAVKAVASMFACQEHGILTPKISSGHLREAEALVDRLGNAGADPAALFAATVVALAQAGGKSIPCEQTPRYIFYARRLLDIYPAARVVHIVRDPRAVMASQKKRWQRRRLAAEGVSIPRYESLRVWVNYHPYTVARLWLRATSEALALEEHPRVTLIRFEDLVQNPEGTVRQLCSRLDVDYDERMLDVHQVNSSHQSSAGGARKGLRADAIDKWKDALTPTEICITERYCGHHMLRFGYESGAREPVALTGELRYRLSYLAHLGGVLLVNPRRAYVQGTALLRSRTRSSRRAQAVPTAARGNRE